MCLCFSNAWLTLTSTLSFASCLLRAHDKQTLLSLVDTELLFSKLSPTVIDSLGKKAVRHSDEILSRYFTLINTP